MPFLPFALPDITEAEIEAVAEAMRSGWLTTGPKVQRFEALLAEETRARHVVATNSGTAALHVALLSYQIAYHGAKSTRGSANYDFDHANTLLG